MGWICIAFHYWQTRVFFIVSSQPSDFPVSVAICEQTVAIACLQQQQHPSAAATSTIISTKGWMKLRGCEWRLVLTALLLWLPLAIRDVVACCCCASVRRCCTNSCHVVAVSDSSNSSSSNIDRGKSLREHDRRWRCLMMRWRYFVFRRRVAWNQW